MIELRLVDDNAEQLASLVRWLRDDDDMRAAATITAARNVGEPGQMGSALEVVNVLLSNAIALGSLVVAVAAWRGSRQKPPTVRILDGENVVEVRSLSEADVRVVVYEPTRSRTPDQ
jgi:hypothetical protein